VYSHSVCLPPVPVLFSEHSITLMCRLTYGILALRLVDRSNTLAQLTYVFGLWRADIVSASLILLLYRGKFFCSCWCGYILKVCRIVTS